jgi:hypothetical protein
MKIIETIYDITTDETSIVERDMTQEELTRYEAEQAAQAALQAEADAKEAQRQELLERLGITEEEAQLLLGGN